MHLYFYARGIIPQITLFETIMQGQFWRFRIKGLDKNEDREILVQGALRRSILGAYEYVFPEEALPYVLSVMGVCDNMQGAIPSLTNSFKLACLRGIFGAKKIPKKMVELAKTIPPSQVLRGSERGLSNVNIEGISIHVIGIKKDRRFEYSKGYEQEAL